MANCPGETHFFLRACILRDAWKGTDGFFDRCPMKSDGATKSFVVDGSNVNPVRQFASTLGWIWIDRCECEAPIRANFLEPVNDFS